MPVETDLDFQTLSAAKKKAIFDAAAKPLQDIAAGVCAIYDRATADNALHVLTTLSGFRRDAAAYGTFRLTNGTLSLSVRTGEPPKRRRKKNAATDDQRR